MAASSLAISALTTIANETANNATALESNFSALRTGVNAIVETATGHYHDGTDSRLMYGGLGGMTSDDFALYLIARAGGGRL